MTVDEIKKMFKKILIGGGICLVISVITILATSSKEITTLILCSEIVAYSVYFFGFYKKDNEKIKLQIKEKYGEDAVSRASLLNKDKIKKH